MQTENQNTTISAQEAAHIKDEVKVFSFHFTKTKSVSRAVLISAETKEEAEKFIKNAMEEVEYDLDTQVSRDDWNEGESEWEFTEIEEEKKIKYADGREEYPAVDYDWESDVLPVLSEMEKADELEDEMEDED